MAITAYVWFVRQNNTPTYIILGAIGSAVDWHPCNVGHTWCTNILPRFLRERQPKYNIEMVLINETGYVEGF